MAEAHSVAFSVVQADSMKDAASRRNYKGVFDALLRIAREEGPGRWDISSTDQHSLYAAPSHIAVTNSV
jgi:hypothetical protein